MNCPNCGRVLEPGARFCASCGATVTESTAPNGTVYAQGMPKNGYASSANVPPYGAYTPINMQGTPAPMTTGGWIGRTILLGVLGAIPVVGWIVWLVMLFTWRGDQTKDMSFRNWATAQLVLTLIIAIIAVVFVVILASVGALAGARYYY